MTFSLAANLLGILSHYIGGMSLIVGHSKLRYTTLGSTSHASSTPKRQAHLYNAQRVLVSGAQLRTSDEVPTGDSQSGRT